MLCADFDTFLNVHAGTKTILLLIDPQVDFHEGGALGITGATADAQRTAKFIMENLDKIDEIFVSLDTHNRMHIAHGCFWSSTVDGKGTEPAPFSQLMHDDAAPEDNTLYSIDAATGAIDKSQAWFPKNKAMSDWAGKYSRRLCAGLNRFRLIIWPEHCLIGSPGHAVQPDINAALMEWARLHCDRDIKYVPKGMDNDTEMYSAIQAEVHTTEGTRTNYNLLNALAGCETLVVAGQAQSHCVNYTVRDIVNNFYKADALRAPSRPGSSTGSSRPAASGMKAASVPDKAKIVLLSDAMSSVYGFGEAGDAFLADMRAEGLTVTTAAEFKL